MGARRRRHTAVVTLVLQNNSISCYHLGLISKRNGLGAAHFFLFSARGKLVRVFIDKPNGVDVEDCARVSNHLTHLFAAENVDFDRLEVSSPGLDRPLTKLEDFARFVGEQAQLTLAAPIDGAKRIKGIVRGTDGGNVLVETAAGVRALPFGTIGRARLVPRIDWRKGS